MSYHDILIRSLKSKNYQFIKDSLVILNYNEDVTYYITNFHIFLNLDELIGLFKYLNLDNMNLNINIDYILFYYFIKFTKAPKTIPSESLLVSISKKGKINNDEIVFEDLPSGIIISKSNKICKYKIYKKISNWANVTKNAGCKLKENNQLNDFRMYLYNLHISEKCKTNYSENFITNGGENLDFLNYDSKLLALLFLPYDKFVEFDLLYKTDCISTENFLRFLLLFYCKNNKDIFIGIFNYRFNENINEFNDPRYFEIIYNRLKEENPTKEFLDYDEIFGYIDNLDVSYRTDNFIPRLTFLIFVKKYKEVKIKEFFNDVIRDFINNFYSVDKIIRILGTLIEYCDLDNNSFLKSYLHRGEDNELIIETKERLDILSKDCFSRIYLCSCDRLDSTGQNIFREFLTQIIKKKDIKEDEYMDEEISNKENNKEIPVEKRFICSYCDLETTYLHTKNGCLFCETHKSNIVEGYIRRFLTN